MVRLSLFLAIQIFGAGALASDAFVYQGQLTDNSNSPIAEKLVRLNFEILGNSGACEMWTKNIDVTTGADGTFSVELVDGSNALSDVLKNSGTFTCADSTTYNPTAGSERELKVTIVRVDEGAAGLSDDTDVDIELTPTQVISAVPYAISAQVAESVTNIDETMIEADKIDFSTANLGTASFSGVDLTGATGASASSLDWSDLTNVPADILDGDDDTQLTDAQITAMGFIKTDTNTQLSEAEVDGFVANNGYLTSVPVQSVLAASDGDPSVALNVDADGSVGIGTTTNSVSGDDLLSINAIGRGAGIGIESSGEVPIGVWNKGDNSSFRSLYSWFTRTGASPSGAIRIDTDDSLDITHSEDITITSGSSSDAIRIEKDTGNVGIGGASSGSKLEVAGVIESTSGGIKFPDGTTQTTAVTGGIPSGAIMAFELASCPTGWSPASQAIFSNQIPTDEGTAVYDGASGLSYAFDGNTYGDRSISPYEVAQVTNNLVFNIGKSFSSSVTITGYKAYGANDKGFFEDSTQTSDIKLYGSDSGFKTDGVLLHTQTITDAPALVIDNESIGSWSYQHYWLEFPVNDVGARNTQIAELQFFNNSTISCKKD
jgi:hypothetical protein